MPEPGSPDIRTSSGKDTYISRHLPDLPMVSLDDIRAELGVSVKDAQEPVLAVARERTRVLLRAGKSLVWNATSIHREIRDKRLRFADDYNARVRIVYVEVPSARLRSQNRSRDAEVPEAAMDRMMYRWEVPDQTEAQTIELQVAE
ncbi:MAG: hypothetical protein EON58_22020 [Alphaproteobacteria bacterium]|nr:MAG: hypothetical protein EON58_22020 [Alphaproteobacteria bacterium]